MISRVLCPSNRPLLLLTSRESLFPLGIVEAKVALAHNEVHGRHLARLGPTDTIFALKEGVKETALDLDLFLVVEWQVMAAW